MTNSFSFFTSIDMITQASSFIFYTGKGGSGKTTLACANALRLADEGKRVLLVSTDPASNLHDVLGCSVSERVGAVEGCENLHAVNIDPERAAEAYRDRAVTSLQGILTSAELQKTREELSGACTTEVASFDEFSRFISGEHESGKYDVVVFDTAPTGHTLRLLELPAAWVAFTEDNVHGASCLGPSSALESSQERYRMVMSRLRDAETTTFYLVARAEQTSLKEAARSSRELHELGLKNQQLVINGVYTAIDPSDAYALKIQALALSELQALPAGLQDMPCSMFPLLPYNVLGLEKLRSFLQPALQERIALQEVKRPVNDLPEVNGLDALVDELTGRQEYGLILTMGKGGTGKTITAATLALLIAKRGHRVHLTTTDPAAHIQDYLQQMDGLPDTLSVDRIDPKLETQRYVEKVFAQKGTHLDEQEKKLLLEDLKSPCTEEVAVFHAFSRAIQQARRQFVVVDTAPTGHTLLLLDTAGNYHRDVLRNSGLNKEKIRTPYMYLQDRQLSTVLMISLPETTPMREAAALQEDLRRAGIEPAAWVVNRCLALQPGLQDPLLRARAGAEIAVLDEIATQHTAAMYAVPFVADKNVLPVLFARYCHGDAERSA